MENMQTIKIEGPINENTDLPKHRLGAGETLNIDMEKVTFINSIGVRTWVSWMTMQHPLSKIFLHKCPYVIVNQGNIVAGFFSKSIRVESFFGFFTCSRCSWETLLLMTRGQNYEYSNSPDTPGTVNLPEAKCAKCANEMEPDFVPKSTFRFLIPEKP